MLAFTRWFCGGRSRRSKAPPCKQDVQTPALHPPENKRPIAKRPHNPKYKTVLSIDGGGLRDIIPVMVLIELENILKEYVLKNKNQFFSEKEAVQVNAKDDFDIFLADFFDLVAGTSAGSMVATYIGSKGDGAGELYKKYPGLRHGSMEVMKVAFYDQGDVLFPPAPCKILQLLFNLLKSKYSSDDQRNFLDLIVKDQKMSDLYTGLLVTSYDIEQNIGHTFVRTKKEKGSKAETFVVRTTVRTDPGPTTGPGAMDEYVSDWKATATTQDLLLRDISQASSSAPTFFPPTLLPVSGQPKELRLVDGAVVANNPTLDAVSINKVIAPTDDVRTLAVFSVGTGIQYPKDMTFVSNPGIIWWMKGAYFLDIVSEGTSEYVQAVLYSWLMNEFDFQPGQYSRFQIKGDSSTWPALSSIDDLTQLPALLELGKKLAAQNYENIKNFVEEYILQLETV